jgi:hypothetical protein
VLLRLSRIYFQIPLHTQREDGFLSLLSCSLTRPGRIFSHLTFHEGKLMFEAFEQT